MLAHNRPVRAAAMHFDLPRQREQSSVAVGDDGHDVLGKPALQELEQGSDPSGAFSFQRFPGTNGKRLDRDVDRIHGRSRDHCFNGAGPDIEMAHRPVPHVGPAPGKAVFVVAERFKVVAPRRSPEGFGNLCSLDLHRFDLDTFL